MSNLSLARHDYELEPDSMNHVYLDHKHMGLGGDDSWSPSVHEVICNDAVMFLQNATHLCNAFELRCPLIFIAITAPGLVYRNSCMLIAYHHCMHV